ncbi:MAG: efflux RND transporter periplasmic adaptor subunit [Opitutaceae bacterium]|nr:efflux RND transporter periplasmic adaptor subunit [Opitutaceae bacterium]
MSSPSRRFPAAILWTLNLALLLGGCGEKPKASSAGGGKGDGKGGRGGGGAAPVLVAQAVVKKVPLVIDAIGAVEPLRSTAVRAQVTGTLMRIAIKEGQDVKEGELLFEIDPRPFQNALQSSSADLQKVRVLLENSRAQLSRYQALSAEQMISKEQFQKIQDDVRAHEADLVAAESRVSTARLQLDYCSIRAPLSGRSGNVEMHEGDLVRTNDQNPLVTINQVSPIYVSFGVPQQHLTALHRYQGERQLPVEAVPPGGTEKPENGRLTFIDNAVDSTTGTIKLKGTFANQDHRLWPGQFVNVAVTLAEPEVLTVPTSALQTSQTGQHVFVVSADNVAELRPVTVERSFENDAVIMKGLQAGETVVIDGQLRVVPGRSVQIKALPAATAAEKTAGDAKKSAQQQGRKKKKET